MEDDSIFNKQNVGLFLLLKSKKSENYILSVNIHVLYNSNRGDIKTAQISVFRKSIELIRSKYPKNKISVIWAGDFNSTPKSLIYDAARSGNFSLGIKYRKFEWSGQVSVQRSYKFSPLSARKIMENQASKFVADGRGDKYLKKEERIDDFVNLVYTLSILQLEFGSKNTIKIFLSTEDDTFYSRIYEYIRKGGGLRFQELSGDIQFKSAYQEVKRNTVKHWMTGENLYTSGPEGNLFTVDYIFYQGEGIECIKALDMPQGYDMDMVLPNRRRFSDHYPLVAEFGLK